MVSYCESCFFNKGRPKKSILYFRENVNLFENKKRGFETKPIGKVSYSQPNIKVNVKNNGDEQISSKYILQVEK